MPGRRLLPGLVLLACAAAAPAQPDTRDATSAAEGKKLAALLQTEYTAGRTLLQEYPSMVGQGVSNLAGRRFTTINLPPGTPVRPTGATSPNMRPAGNGWVKDDFFLPSPTWRMVKVIGGEHAGKAGWIREETSKRPVRIRFAVYYNGKSVKDRAFERAARYALRDWDKECKAQLEKVGDGDYTNLCLFFPVVTRDHFMISWHAVDQLVKQAPVVRREGKEIKSRVDRAFLFTHASISPNEPAADGTPGPGRSGLEFGLAFEGDTRATFQKDDIAALPRLAWPEVPDPDQPVIHLHGCNTGLLKTNLLSEVELRRDWCPAREFAMTQGVTTLGQRGDSFFSSSMTEYQRIDAASPEVYLWGFWRKTSSWLHVFSEQAIPAAVYGSDGLVIPGGEGR